LDEPTYLAYVKLRNLSRRSRYLCNSEDPKIDVENAHFIAEKHFVNSFIYLDKLLKWFHEKYNDPYLVTEINFNFKSATPNCIYFKFKTTKPETS
jgi:hypothetical protein